MHIQKRTPHRRQRKAQQKKRYCYFCVNAIQDIVYTDVPTLRRFTSSFGKIVPRRRSGVCATHQRKLATAIKRARIAALLPFAVR